MALLSRVSFGARFSLQGETEVEGMREGKRKGGWEPGEGRRGGKREGKIGRS